MPNRTTNEDLLNNRNSSEAERGYKSSNLYDPTNRINFNKAPNEIVYSNKETNAFIVLGRDRPGGWDSGYSGMGHVKAGAIDIVVGRVSSLDAQICGPINPSMGADAARIYLSQKSDIDKNFELPDGTTKNSEAESAIAIKADAVRVIARNSLKLVTHTDSISSTGFQVMGNSGVQLITKTNPSKEEDMHPIPRGHALAAALEKLVFLVNELNGQVTQFLNLQTDFNVQIANHTHFSPFWGQKTSFDPNVLLEQKKMYMQQFSTCQQGLTLNASSLQGWIGEHLLPSKDTYINSKFHSLN